MERINLGLWRVAYCTDLTSAKAKPVPLAFMLEARWEDGARWIGLLYRTELTKNELREVDTKTWPELTNVEVYMKQLFLRGCDTDAAALAASHPCYSAVQFQPLEAAIGNIEGNTPRQAAPMLYSYLLGYEDELEPAFGATVIRIPLRRPQEQGFEMDQKFVFRSAA